jgi:Fur family ferric uptake transcriptional regulator
MPRKAKRNEIVADLRTRIRSVGLRSTPARMAVLQALGEHTTPVTHAELAAELVPQGFDKATVYRNLIDLTDAGLVSRSELGDHVWRFELRRETGEHTGEHPHFLCIDCGEVSCLSDVDISISPLQGRKAAPIGQVTEVLLKGHCGRCSQ